MRRSIKRSSKPRRLPEGGYEITMETHIERWYIIARGVQPPEGEPTIDLLYLREDQRACLPLDRLGVDGDTKELLRGEGEETCELCRKELLMWDFLYSLVPYSTFPYKTWVDRESADQKIMQSKLPNLEVGLILDTLEGNYKAGRGTLYIMLRLHPLADEPDAARAEVQVRLGDMYNDDSIGNEKTYFCFYENKAEVKTKNQVLYHIEDGLDVLSARLKQLTRAAFPMTDTVAQFLADNKR